MRTALVTGASNGIGLELARVFAADGWDMVLTARSEDKLQALAVELRGLGRTVTVLPSDLARDGAAHELFGAVERAGIQIEALVNNAGVASYGEFVRVPVDVDIDEIHLNVVALTHLTKLFLPAMIERKKGYVLNVASLSSFFPGPHMAVYYATKAYVLSLTEALAQELQGTGVRVTALCPGPTESGFQQRANLPRTRLYARRTMDPMRVAREGYRAMLAGRTISIPGWWNRVLAFSPRISPRPLLGRVVGTLNSPAPGR